MKAFALILPRIVSTNTLVFQRRDDKAPTDPSVLGLFGGSIEEDEAPLDAAFRELCEETSLSVGKDDLRLIKKTQMPSIHGWADVYLYTLDIDDASFEVFEGSGYECYTRLAFMARMDVSERAVTILKKIEL